MLVLAGGAQAQSFPALSGRVVDAANILPPEQKARLTGQLAALEKESGRQMVVVTLADLQGYTIEDYGYRLGRAWAIGQKKIDNGLLLIVAPKERKVRIEVGYGLEPIVTDALSSIIIQQQILPAFRAGDLPAGVDAGASALIALLKLPDAQAQARAQKIVADARARQPRFDFAALIPFLIMGVILFLWLARRRGGVGYGGSGGPIILWGPGLGSGGWGSGGGSSGSDWGAGGFSGGGGSFGGGGSSGSW